MPDTRTALADRLNVDPGHLDDLFLPPDQFTEDVLQQRFGLAAIADATPPMPAGNPDLVTWQLDRLHLLWREQDANQPSDSDIPVVVDPDLVGQDDLRHPTPGNLAFDLWTSRRQWVAAQLNTLHRNGWRPAPRPTAFSSS